jgi:hypothetical protein
MIDEGLSGIFEGWAEAEASKRSAVLQEAWRLGDFQTREAVKVREPEEDWKAETFLEEMQIAWQAERLETLKRLLEFGLRRFPEHPDLLHWQRLVTPATIHIRESTEAEQQNKAWLEMHREDEGYKGYWVALREGKVLDKDISLRDLRKRIGSEKGEVLFVEVKK